MGVWGAGLYANDVTADLRSVFRDLARLPISTEDLIQRLTGIFSDAASPEDELYTSFWLATADLLHAYGFDAPLIYTRALDMIGSGKDLNLHRELGLSKRDLQRREKELRKLAAKLSNPNPKPRNRRVLLKPEAWVFCEGTLVAYPTNQGDPVNPYLPERYLVDWVADGWGAFVVLGRDRLYDFFAVYLIAILPPLGSSEPDVQMIMAQENSICVAALVTVPSSHPRRMRIRELATFGVKQSAVESHFVPGTPPFDFRPRVLADALYLDAPGYSSKPGLDPHKFVDFIPSSV